MGQYVQAKGQSEGVLATHVLEHFSYREVIFLLAECHRILRTGGEFLICVPNARLYIEAYVNKLDLASTPGFITHRAAYSGVSPIDYVNYIAYNNGEHKILYDEINLVLMLKSAGFSEAGLRAFDPNLDPELRRHESLFIRAMK